MESISPIILLGPSTIGKSALAGAIEAASTTYTVASITADKYYLYASPDIMLGIGLTTDDICNRAQRLYGTLAPEDPLPSPEAYVDMAATQVNEVQALGGLAIVEGCSVSYGKALMDRFGLPHAIRLTWRERYPVRLALEVKQAYQKLLDLGLYDETERNIDLGFEDIYPMSSLIYKPTVLALKGKITHRQADELVVTKWVDEALRADQAFAELGIPTLWPTGAIHDR